MALRKRSPQLNDLRRRYAAEQGDRFLQVMLSPKLDDSKYFHWEQLLRRTPPAELTHEEWWLKLKMQREAESREVELFAKDGTRFSFSLADELLHLSEQISRRTGGAVVVGGRAVTPEGRDSYIVRSLVEEAITSSQLEGASTTRRAALEMLDTGRDPLDQSERMILNNFRAMQLVKDHASDPLTPEFVLVLHAVLTEGTLEDPADAGRLQAPGEERVAVVTGDEQVVHIPPPAAELPLRMQQLCTFATGTVLESPYIPPVVRAIVSHFMLGYDHAFVDGNGRLARTVFYWGMLHNGYWLAEYLSISKILRNAPAKYGLSYEYTEDDDGDLTYFILHQLRTIVRALDELDAYIESRRTETREVRKRLEDVDGRFNARQVQLIEWITREDPPSIIAAEVARRYRVTPQTARNDLTQLEAVGLLVRGTSGRPVHWMPVADLAERLARHEKQN